MDLFKKINIFFNYKIDNFNSQLEYRINKNPYSFDDLTPSIIKDGIYDKSLYWALRNKNIKNIALTGTYGSGKSSIIKSFKNKHKEFNFLNISLATFDDKGKKDTKKVELSILQQMLYLEKSENIPFSRFNRIRNVKKYSLMFYTIILFTVLLSFLFLLQPDFLINIKFIKDVLKNEQILKNLTNIKSISLLILIIGVFFILRAFIKASYYLKFNKINLKGDIELNREVDKNSILNRNLDEIIYFFERTKYNVVIIEDLDRFEKPVIFTKLREINLLINNSKQISRHITFIYALKDEMFKDEKRTKFFDFIIPIIPVINSSNSFEFLENRLSNNDINKNLLYDISLYINDMRLLKNIVNEYVIYKTKLTKIDLNPNKLLAFTVYKNLFPEDYAKLHYNKGMIFKVFNEYIIKLKYNSIGKVKIEIEKIKEKILELENLKINNIYDLRKVYILKLFENLPTEKNVAISLTGSYKINQLVDLISDEVFKELVKQDTISYTFDRYNPSYSRWDPIYPNSTLKFKAIEDMVDENFSYLEKESLIIEKQNNKREDYNIEIDKYNGDLNNINRSVLKDIIASSIEGFGDKLKRQDILIYFLRNGYLAEDYFDYISIFYEGSITINDKNFILSIRNKRPLELNYKLDKIEGVIKNIEKDFYKEEILNINLLEYLFENQKDKLISKLFFQYSNINERLINFVDLYINEGQYIDKFIKEICHYWDGFWTYIIFDSNYTQANKDLVLKKIVFNASKDDIIKQNDVDFLANYISEKLDFLIVFSENNDKVKEILLLLDIKFKSLINIEVNETLFDFIYKNNLYEINEKMIELIVNQKGEFTDGDINNLKCANYTTILNSKCTNLIDYLENNLNEYINKVFLDIEENINEKSEGLTKLLNINNEKLANNYKISIIEKEHVKFIKLNEITDFSLWENILKKNKVKATWANLIEYYTKYEFDSYIISFLNIDENVQELSAIILKEDSNKDFIQDLLLSDEIEDSSYSLLIKSFETVFDTLEFDLINDFKIQKIIEQKLIQLNFENFNALRQNLLNNDILLIELNFEKYLIEKGDFDFSELEYEKLLNSKILSNDNKVKIINELEAVDLNIENNLADIVLRILNSQSLKSI